MMIVLTRSLWPEPSINLVIAPQVSSTASMNEPAFGASQCATETTDA